MRLEALTQHTYWTRTVGYLLVSCETAGASGAVSAVLSLLRDPQPSTTPSDSVWLHPLRLPSLGRRGTDSCWLSFSLRYYTSGLVTSSPLSQKGRREGGGFALGSPGSRARKIFACFLSGRSLLTQHCSLFTLRLLAKLSSCAICKDELGEL